MSEPLPNQAPDQPRRRRRVALYVSLAFHAVLLTLLVVVPYQLWYAPQSAATSSRSSAADDPAAGHGKVTRPEEVTAEKVQARLDSVIKQADKLSDQEKLSRLEGAAKRLEGLASEESVNDLSGRLQGWLGTPERAAQPSKKPVEGPFDYNSAQYHDVRRVRGNDGQWQYTAILIDNKGRLLEAPMTTANERAEAEKVYQTMRVLKANPLADKLYRDVGMGQIDNLIGALEKLQQAGKKAQAAQEQGALRNRQE